VPVPPASYPRKNVKKIMFQPLYPPLRSLPLDPARLLARLTAFAAGGGSPAEREDSVFTLIGSMIEMPVGSQLRAALYEAIERLPGITLVADAVDAAGRHGFGVEFRWLEGSVPAASEYIISLGTGRYLGAIVSGPADANDGPKAARMRASTADVVTGLVTRR
jgi:hypothetical protein